MTMYRGFQLDDTRPEEHAGHMDGIDAMLEDNMSDRITVTTMTLIEHDADILRRLGFEDGNADEIGDLYQFTATGSGNVGHAIIEATKMAIEWGGDPQLLWTPLEGTDREMIEAALNGELYDA